MNSALMMEEVTFTFMKRVMKCNVAVNETEVGPVFKTCTDEQIYQDLT
jgi:hypothetical protein